jgi:hypothetical protein
MFFQNYARKNSAVVRKERHICCPFIVGRAVHVRGLRTIKLRKKLLSRRRPIFGEKGFTNDYAIHPIVVFKLIKPASY